VSRVSKGDRRQRCRPSSPPAITWAGSPRQRSYARR